LPDGFFLTAPGVSQIKLGNSQLTRVSALWFPPANALDLLHFEHCRIATIEPGAFQHLAAVVSLTLTSNALTSLDDTTFVGLSSLRWLALEFNDLRMIGAETFRPLTRLQSLNCTRNALQALPENVFQDLFQLQSIVLTENRLARLPKSLAPLLPRLISLRLSHNPLTVVESDTLQAAPTLTSLFLDNTRLHTLNVPHVPSLILIDASFNPLLTSVTLSGVMPKLEMLNLAECTLLNEINAHGARSLDVSGTGIPLDNVDCLSVGKEQLIAFDMLHHSWDATDAIQKCLFNEGRRLLDVSRNRGLAKLGKLRLNSGEDYTLAKLPEFVSFIGSNKPVRQLPQLVAGGGPTSCTLKTSVREWQGSGGDGVTPVASYECDCVPGYYISGHGEDAVCQQNVPWLVSQTARHCLCGLYHVPGRRAAVAGRPCAPPRAFHQRRFAFAPAAAGRRRGRGAGAEEGVGD